MSIWEHLDDERALRHSVWNGFGGWCSQKGSQKGQEDSNEEASDQADLQQRQQEVIQSLDASPL